MKVFRLIALIVAGTVAVHAAPPPQPRWIATWACAPVVEAQAGRKELKQRPFEADATIRNIVHVSMGGSVIRVRVSNEFGTEAIQIGGVHVAGSAGGGAITPGTDHAATFGGQPAASIPAGKTIYTDPISIDVAPESSLAVSLFVPKQHPTTVTVHEVALSRNFFAPGNQLAAAQLTDSTFLKSWLLLTGIDVQSLIPNAATIAAVGDSITDGNASTVDANMRWPDELGRRLQASPATAHLAVVDLGIGGNRVLLDGNGPSAIHRFDRDVLGQSGIKFVILLEGINDIGGATHHRGKPVSTAEIIDGMKLVIGHAHAHGLKIFGATLTPCGGGSMCDSAAGQQMHDDINQWILTSHSFDAVIDFDKATADPASPLKLLGAYDTSGGHIHPNDAGYKAMGDAIDLTLFR